MTTYSFKVTKGKYQLSLTTTDRDMIVDQFEKWVRRASDYVQTNKGQNTSRFAAKSGAEKRYNYFKV